MVTRGTHTWSANSRGKGARPRRWPAPLSAQSPGSHRLNSKRICVILQHTTRLRRRTPMIDMWTWPSSLSVFMMRQHQQHTCHSDIAPLLASLTACLQNCQKQIEDYIIENRRSYSLQYIQHILTRCRSCQRPSSMPANAPRYSSFKVSTSRSSFRTFRSPSTSHTADLQATQERSSEIWRNTIQAAHKLLPRSETRPCSARWLPHPAGPWRSRAPSSGTAKCCCQRAHRQAMLFIMLRTWISAHACMYLHMYTKMSEKDVIARSAACCAWLNWLHRMTTNSGTKFRNRVVNSGSGIRQKSKLWNLIRGLSGPIPELGRPNSRTSKSKFRKQWLKIQGPVNLFGYAASRQIYYNSWG